VSRWCCRLRHKEIVTAINTQGGKAVGISGKDANLMRAKRLEAVARSGSDIEQIAIRFVGDPAAVDPHIIDVIINSDLIPVVARSASAPTARRSTSMPTLRGGARLGLEGEALLLLTTLKGADRRTDQYADHGEAQALIDDGTSRT